MRNHRIVTVLTALTFVTGTAFAAPTNTAAQRQTPNYTQQRGSQHQTLQEAYDTGNPLTGGLLIKSTTVTAQRGAPLFQNAPQGPTDALITTPFGKQVVNLKPAQAQAPDRGAPGQAAGPDARRGGRQEQTNAPESQCGTPGSMAAGQRSGQTGATSPRGDCDAAPPWTGQRRAGGSLARRQQRHLLRG
ncbi:hypothetical protein LAJ19_16355 (plasmid) [Deinococcus taeanensis]|uniref:hypothetical protein n=1 Tax=Deinococcus taeanensis TaxID=2737050 RepID=UPI001CDC78DD|nr:hypothetical protein [Deinococcus taeanensis]UBV44728.1 hypothetical protein LAJ19_16355 [Deinococcus taeanensis]